MSAWIAAGAAILSTLISCWFAYKIKKSGDRSTSDSTIKQIEAGAYDRAQAAFNDALKLRETEILSLRDRLSQVEGELSSERGERREAIRTAHEELTQLRMKLNEAEVTIATLRRVIASQRRGDLPPGIDLEQPPQLRTHGHEENP